MLSIQRLLEKTYGCLSIVLALVFVAPGAHAVIPGDSQQLVVVITESWDSTTGKMQTFTRGYNDRWQADELRAEVILGTDGLGTTRWIGAPTGNDQFTGKK